MKTLVQSFILGLAIFACPLAEAKEDLVTLFTGFQKGTYSVIGTDIQKVCTNLNITVEPGGSIANLNALINEPVLKSGHRLALIQKDVYDVVIGPTKDKPVKMVMKLFPEEIVIMVNKSKGIKTLEDLAGRKVSAGMRGSGMWFTSSIIEQSLGVKWLNVERTPEESILLALTGEIDAMVVVGSNPLRLLEELPISFSQYMDIIPIRGYPQLDKIYPHNATVPAKTYIWQKSDIETKSTFTYLVASSDVPDNIIKEVQSCITKNLPSLKKLGHPKWKRLQ